MLLVIAAGIVVLAVSGAIGVLLFRLSDFVLGGTVTVILAACLFVWWGWNWWKRKKEKYEDYASANEIEYLEELADEHKRGVRDHGNRLRFLLPRFGDRNPQAREQYKDRLDKIRRIIGDI
jgi:hypothetical protein